MRQSPLGCLMGLSVYFLALPSLITPWLSTGTNKHDILALFLHLLYPRATPPLISGTVITCTLTSRISLWSQVWGSSCRATTHFSNTVSKYCTNFTEMPPVANFLEKICHHINSVSEKKITRNSTCNQLKWCKYAPVTQTHASTQNPNSKHKMQHFAFKRQ